MARIARIVFPEIPHHITQRGNRHADVFFDTEDRIRYLDFLKEHCQMNLPCRSDAFIEHLEKISQRSLHLNVSTITDFAAGTVDVLRLGKGASDGGFGYVSDFFRFLSVLGPIGKSLKMIGGGITRRMGILLKDPASARGICTWVAAAKVLRHTGSGKMFAKVDDVAKLMGKSFSSIKGYWADDLVMALRAMGGKVRNVGIPNSMDHVVETAKKLLPNNGAMLFAVK